MLSGEAKTIYVTNASIVPNIVDMVFHLQLTPDDQVLMSSPPTFDPHIIDIIVSFISKARLVILPRHRLQSQTSSVATPRASCGEMMTSWRFVIAVLLHLSHICGSLPRFSLAMALICMVSPGGRESGGPGGMVPGGNHTHGLVDEGNHSHTHSFMENSSVVEQPEV